MSTDFDVVLPHQLYNLLMVIVTIATLLWGMKAVKRLYVALRVRRAMQRDRIVHLRGLGSYLSYFENATQTHVNAIVHTRQSKPPVKMKTISIPCCLEGFCLTRRPQINGTSSCVLVLHVNSRVQGKIVVLYNFDRMNFERAFNAIRQKVVMEQRIPSAEKGSETLSRLLHCSANRPASSSEHAFEVSHLQMFEACSHQCLFHEILSTGKQIVELSLTGEVCGDIDAIINHRRGGMPYPSPPQNEGTHLSQEDAHAALATLSNRAPVDPGRNDNAKALSFCVLLIPVHTNDGNNKNSVLQCIGSPTDMEIREIDRQDSDVVFLPSSTTRLIARNRYESYLAESDSIEGCSKQIDTKTSPLHGEQSVADESGRGGADSGDRTAIGSMAAALCTYLVQAPVPRNAEEENAISKSIAAPVSISVIDSNCQIYRPSEIFGLATATSSESFGESSPAEETKRTTAEAAATKALAKSPSMHRGGKFVHEDCVVCLSESKSVSLLPCRHLCVCTSCLTYIDKCPVCRTGFEEYVVINGEPAPSQQEGGETNG